MGDMISVVIPTYNRRDNLRLSLLSLMKQEYPDGMFEIIVVDEGSTDMTDDMVNKLRKVCPHTIVYRRIEKGGFRVALTRNMGARLASGDILVFLDADVVAMPFLLERYRKAIKGWDCVIGYSASYHGERGYNPIEIEKAISGGSLSRMEIIPEFRETEFRDQSRNNSLSNKKVWKIFTSSNFCIRKEVFLENPFDESFTGWGAEDEEFGYRLAKEGKMIKMSADCVGLNLPNPGKPSPGIYTEEKVGSLLKNLLLFLSLHPVPEVEEHIFERYRHIPEEFKRNERMRYLVRGANRIMGMHRHGAPGVPGVSG